MRANDSWSSTALDFIEIVQNDSADPAFKLLLARLYNAKVKLSALCESFGVDPKTVRRWGKVLLQGDPAELVRVLEGRNACHKLTAAVEDSARWRWPDLVAQRSYGAVGRLLLEIQSVFGIEISRSGLGLIRILKGATSPRRGKLFFGHMRAPGKKFVSFSAGEKVDRDRRSHQPSRAG